MLTRARNSLGIDASTADDMHTTTFAEEVKSLLGKADGLDEDTDLSSLKFKDGAKERVRFNVMLVFLYICIYAFPLTVDNNSSKIHLYPLIHHHSLQNFRIL